MLHSEDRSSFASIVPHQCRPSRIHLPHRLRLLRPSLLLEGLPLQVPDDVLQHPLAAIEVGPTISCVRLWGCLQRPLPHLHRPGYYLQRCIHGLLRRSCSDAASSWEGGPQYSLFCAVDFPQLARIQGAPTIVAPGCYSFLPLFNFNWFDFFLYDN